MNGSMYKQLELPLELEQDDFSPVLEKKDEGIPSAHDPEKKYFPKFNGKYWVCDGPNGPCEHFKYYGTPCRHILKKKFENMKEMYAQISDKVDYNRDLRDLDCQEFDEVITYVSCFKEDIMNKLATLMLNIGVMRGKVTTDDLHRATNEEFYNNKIVGVVTGHLARTGLIQEIGRKKTERKCAHGRKINIYQVTKKGFEYLRDRRPEMPLKDF